MAERRIEREDVDAFAAGAAILGAGGGGDVRVGAHLLRHLLAERSLRLVPAADLPPDGIVVHTGAVGSPDVISERLLSPVDLARAAAAVAEQVMGPIRAAAAFEIGGLNALVGAIGAIELGLPFVDGDLMGRAFPKLTQNTLALNGVAPVPLAVASPAGDVVVVPLMGPRAVEPILAGITAGMGGAASVAGYPIAAGDLDRMGVRGSVSACIELGRRFLAARSAALPVLIGDLGARLHGVGRVEEIVPRSSTAPGTLTVIDGGDGAVVRVDHQEEFLATTVDGVPGASTPDVVAVLDNRSRRPLQVEEVRVGQAVVVCSLPALHTWPASARHLVGPSAFGLVEMEER
ncbi:DUF917 domain-containing protein [Nocardioides nitrophenolicus]|uniref:DUF917 domain-containing protein n=1 Tax=Nocardioides nitrophenolicus TaxID=60489 RepID=UPI00195FA7B5|nr:DUF917 domain-containing protein [Nocardioides nitrophenolicus]MBM7520438.1 DUF917 family protein [Nocardioides nitrophenolicus]